MYEFRKEKIKKKTIKNTLLRTRMLKTIVNTKQIEHRRHEKLYGKTSKKCFILSPKITPKSHRKYTTRAPGPPQITKNRSLRLQKLNQDRFGRCLGSHFHWYLQCFLKVAENQKKIEKNNSDCFANHNFLCFTIFSKNEREKRSQKVLKNYLQNALEKSHAPSGAPKCAETIVNSNENAHPADEQKVLQNSQEQPRGPSQRLSKMLFQNMKMPPECSKRLPRAPKQPSTQFQ